MQIARTADSLVGRFHAMWTLEGLGALDAALVREQMKDPNPRMRIQALRASESLYKAGDRTFDADYRAMAKDPDTDVVIQAMLTLRCFKAPDLAEVVKGAQSASSARGVKEIGNFLLAPAPVVAGGAALSSRRIEGDRGGHGDLRFASARVATRPDGRGVPLAGGAPGAMMAPSLAGSPRVNGHRDYVDQRPAQGHDRSARRRIRLVADIMVPMGIEHRRVGRRRSRPTSGSSFGNAGGLVTPADVTRVRAATQSRRTPWTLKDLDADDCRVGSNRRPDGR